MDKYREMQVFVSVVDAGSFVAASEALNSSKAAVSRYISDLEARLGVRLLNRTTRKLSLTDEGHAFYSRCKDVLTAIEEAESEVTSSSIEPRGLLRISAPLTFGILHLAPLWAEFMRQYPKVDLDVSLSDRQVDLVEEGIDVAIRIASLSDSTLVSRKLASTRLVLCASPEYVRQRGEPMHPSDLASHDVAAYTLMASGDEWTFEGPDGPVKVRTHPRFHTNNGDTCRALALAHRAVILQPTFLIGKDLREERLVELLPDFHAKELGVYAIYPSRKHLPPKIRLLVDFLAKELQDMSWGR